MTRSLLALLIGCFGLAQAQPYTWPEAYLASSRPGGAVKETSFGDFTTLNPVLTSNATENAVITMYAGPPAVNRDWLGTRTFRLEDGSFNLFWAKEIEEVRPDQEYIVTVREGWRWSDGVEMTADDAIATWTVVGDPDVESNNYSCSVVGEEPIEFEKLGKYQYRFALPEPQVNALAANDCVTVNRLVPAHVFMPVYQAEGAAGVKRLWGVDTPPAQIVSGGPYTLSEFRPGERIVLTKNPRYGEFVRAADGSPATGPDTWTVTLTEDENAELALVTTGQASFYWPTSLDQVRAVRDAVDGGTIPGAFYPNIGPDTLVDFFFYNFNNTDPCKRAMFRERAFRQAISSLIDRQALIDAALGGLGFAAKDWQSEAAAPFNAPELPDFEYNPNAGVELLRSVGFTELGGDGVLQNPETGCRAEFTLQYNAGNNRRAQEVLVISQTLAPYGVKVNPREVSTEIWTGAWEGTSVPRPYDFDAMMGGLAGGDIDNPSFDNGLRVASILNGWNKDKASAEPWELTMDRLTVRMNNTLDLGERVALYNERAALMREYLPLTPLISPAFHFYHNLSNVWPEEALDATSIENPYRPGSFRETQMAP